MIFLVVKEIDEKSLNFIWSYSTLVISAILALNDNNLARAV
jgi:hypothetical protein